MATVTPSTIPRTPNPPDHIKTTPSTTGPPGPVDTLNGGGHLPTSRPALYELTLSIRQIRTSADGAS